MVHDTIDLELSDGTGGPLVEGVAGGNYSSAEVGLSFSQSRADGRKTSQAEILVGFSSVGDVDAIDLVAGTRFYPLELFGLLASKELPVEPYLGIHTVNTFFEDQLGLDSGTQLGLRLGGGVEVQLGSSAFFLDVGGDYLINLRSSTGLAINGLDTELTGFALRVGIGFSL